MFASSHHLSPGAPGRSSSSAEPGTHPIGTGVGATLGAAAAGAAMGTVAGPLGTLIGAAAGAVLGGIAGRDVAQTFDPLAQVAPPLQQLPPVPPRARRTPALPQGTYARLKPAYRYGWDSYQRWEGCDFEQIEPELARGWDKARGEAVLGWHEARGPVRDAWMRAGEAAAIGVFR